MSRTWQWRPRHADYWLLQGDWKIFGLGLTIPLMAADGSPSRWEYPGFDGRVPSYIQRSFDYMGIPTPLVSDIIMLKRPDSSGICFG